MTDFLWLVIAIPLAIAVINLLFGRRLGEPFAGILATLAVAASFVFAAVAASGFISGTAEPVSVKLFTWIPYLGIQFELLWDPLSILLTLIVTGVGSLIHLYSIGYMHGDERFSRFFCYMNLFISSMLILVLAANYAIMFIGWELVGLCSYLLISFWFEKPTAAAAGKKAFIVTRIGDWGFMIALMLIFASFGTFDFGVIFATAPTVLSVGMATAITLMLFAGATGKSAQIPLYVWLPDAMEGPTPISALIHAATMVAAGVFMIARSAVLFEMAPISGMVVAIIGVATALLAAAIAVGQKDIKKVLAYSTISQLGYMMLAVGVGAYTAGVFHLMTHAFFKALLFLGAGSVIHAMSGEQDMSRMGALRKFMPITFSTMIVAWLAISGIFPFSGFWSKDEILAATFAAGGFHYVLWFVGLVVVVLTAFYMTRMMVMTFFGTKRWEDGVHPHESPTSMTFPLIILGIFSFAIGWINTPFRHGFDHYLAPTFERVVHPEAPTDVVLWSLAALTTLATLVGIGWALVKYRQAELPAETSPWWRWSLGAFFVDRLYSRTIVAPGRAASDLAVTIDNKGFDGVANGMAAGTKLLATTMRPIQSGKVRSYAGVFAFAGVVLIVVMVLIGGGF